MTRHSDTALAQYTDESLV